MIKASGYYLDAFFIGVDMLTKEDLLTQNTIPLLKETSLELYKEFSENILIPTTFLYYFTDGTTMTIQFVEWGIYHLLGIQHIDYTIKKNTLFDKIDNGLTYNTFKNDSSINKRFRTMKKRICMFSCIYDTLKKGHVFYLPSGKVKNTKNVCADFIIYQKLQSSTAGISGMNVGIRKVDDIYVPLTNLISPASDLTMYIDEGSFKLVQKLEILNADGDVVEAMSYAPAIITKDTQ